MQKFSTGLIFASRADVKTGLAVRLSASEQQNLILKIWSHFLAVHKKVILPLLELLMPVHSFMVPPKCSSLKSYVQAPS